MRRWLAWLAMGAAACASNACTQKSPVAPAAVTNVASKPNAPHAFSPPTDKDMPDGRLGDVIRRGRDIFTDTPQHAKAYVGNGLSCSNCHLDAGRLPHSAPLWGAYGMYPQYRKKTGQVNTFGERLQGCFLYSMNGKAPALDSAEIVALETYAWWMAKGAPTGVKLPGAGYPKLAKPALAADYGRGEKVYEKHCALCHGSDGQGQQAAGRQVFPPLWGPQSFNWGAGMHQLDNAAGFIKANMPFSRGGTLSNQDAWDVAMFMDAHERPQDPRYTGNVEQTRRKYHDTPDSLYGTEVNGHLLGTPPASK
jgi:thiosulfate dehydrogenase